MIVASPEPKQMEDGHVMEFDTTASPQNSAVYSTNGRSRLIRARTPAANSIGVCLGGVFCHGTARGSQERGGEELLLNTLLEYRDRWRHVHAPQGRLDSTQRQGNTGLLKGRLN